jgi:hypothetical protein
MVDALDVVGTCPVTLGSFTFALLTRLVRSRVSNLDPFVECSEVAFGSYLGEFVNRRSTFSPANLLQDAKQKLKPGQKGKPEWAYKVTTEETLIT